jgi:hypothetical protein
MSDATLLEIVQDAAVDVGVASPGTVINNSDETAVQMLKLLKRETRNLSFSHPWTELTFEHTFTGNGTSSSYSLPTDFAHVINETLWDRSQSKPINGPLSPKEWQFLHNGMNTNTGPNARFRIWQKKFFMFPRTQSANSFVYEYKTDLLVLASAAATPKTTWTVDTDIARWLDGETLTLGLIWRFKKAKGLAYADEVIEYMSRRDADIIADGGSRILNATPGRPEPFLGIYTPDSGFGS